MSDRRTSFRAEFGQLSWALRDLAHREVRRRDRAARRALHLPALPRSPRRKGTVWAVTMVRNEEDIISRTVTHLLAQGIDHVLVADNLSTDRTRQVLDDLGDERVHVATDEEPAYFQGEKMSKLARAAWRSGADWVVPFDADELWFGRDSSVAQALRSIAADCPGVGMVKAALHDAIPTDGLRPDLETSGFLMDSSPSVPGKVAFRAHPLARLAMGNHAAMRVGDVVEGLHIAHLAYRSVDQVAGKARRGAAAVEQASSEANIAWHWRNIASLDDRQIEELWTSVQRGEPHPEINLHARGPMVPVRPLTWTTWDPEKRLAAVV